MSRDGRRWDVRGAWTGIVALLLLAACGGGGGDPAGSDGSGGGGLVDSGGGAGGDATLDVAAAVDVRTVCDGPCYEVLFLGESPVVVANGERRTIRLHVLDYRAQTPAAGVPLTLRLTGPATGTSTVAPESVVTDESGDASVEFHGVEAAAPVSWLLIAGAPGSADASLEIEVVPGAEGSVAVGLAYDGTLPLAEIEVRVAAGTARCADLSPAAPPEAVASRMIAGTATSVGFDGLPGGSSFVVTAVAWAPLAGASRHLAAFGCRDDVLVEAGGTTTVRIDLFEVTLRVAGTYDATLELSLGAAAPVSALATLDAFAAGTQGADVYQDLARRMRAAHAEGRTGPALDAFEQALITAFFGWRDAAGPAWLGDGPFSAGVAAVFSGTALTGPATLTEDAERLLWVGGEVAWEELSFPSDPRCTEATCGRLSFGVVDLGAATAPVILEPESWTGTVRAVDQLSVNSHRLSLDVGALARLALDRIVLGGAGLPSGGVRAAIAAWPDCDAVAARVAPAALAPVGIDSAGVATLCREVADAEVEDVLDALDEMADGGHVRLTATARLLDPGDDLEVDAFTDGVVSGQASDENDAILGAVEGTWRATRR